MQSLRSLLLRPRENRKPLKKAMTCEFGGMWADEDGLLTARMRMRMTGQDGSRYGWTEPGDASVTTNMWGSRQVQEAFCATWA